VIIVLTGSLRGEEYAAAIEGRNHQKTLLAASRAEAVACLQEQDAEALVIDQSFQMVENGIDSLVASHAETAMPIYVNLSLHGPERVAVEVSCGLQRLVRERLLSMRAATKELNSKLGGEVTAILLNAELALRERSLPSGVTERLRVVCETAERMRQRLEGGAPEPRKMVVKPRLVTKHADAPAAL
jgi:hypothetical protein